MSATIIDSLKAYDVLLQNRAGLECHKTAIYAVAGPAPREAKGTNSVDGFEITVPKGYYMSIAGHGEIQALVREKNNELQPTHAKLYDMENPMSYDEARVAARSRNVVCASKTGVQVALEDVGVEMPFNWYNSLGHCLAFRMPKGTGRIDIPKPTWWNVEPGEGHDVLMLNLRTDEVYKIAKAEFIAQWHADSSPDTKDEDFYNLIPVLSQKVFTSIVHTGSTAQELLEQQQKDLGLV